MEYKKQVEKSHYSFESYFYPGRWMSYWYQAKEILKREKIKSILDVGPGTTVLRDSLKIHKPELDYKTLDIAEDLKPDLVGSIVNIPAQDNSVNLVSAFQVLEHIKFSDFEKALIEMKRVSNKYVFISLPHYGPSLEFSLKIPHFKVFRFALKFPRPKKHVFCGQHYWEIGKRGYSVRKIRKIISQHFVILEEYIPFENQYHRFYIMKIK